MPMARRDLTFWVFVSSTFSDLKAERNALQERAFSRLRAYCQEKGARFQAIDLRWGVSEEATLDQQTMNICLQELRRCQMVSPRPNFITLLGERYGSRPLPPQIEASEFEALLKRVPADQQPLLLKWYKRDDNAVPPEYCLQPRKVDVGNAQTDQEKQAAHDTEARQWSEQTEPLLHSLLVSAAREVFPDSEDPRCQKYEDSATHQEIRYGAFKAEDPQSYVFAYFRTIEGLPGDDSVKDFLDIKDGTIDVEAHNRLQSLKKELGGDRERRGLLPPQHVYEYIAQWSNGQLQSDLQALCNRVESDLREIIDSELAAFQQASELEREVKAHQEFGQQRAEHFIGRREILDEIQAYLASECNSPLVIHGVSGSGKTGLLAHAIQTTEEAFPYAGTIVRFIGSTPSSSDGRSLLESLCHQIYEAFNFEEQKRNLLAQIKDNDKEAQEGRQRIEEEYSVPSEYQKLSTTFRDFLTKIPKAKKLLLFLDALDQLSDTDHARSLYWLPDNLQENVRLIVSCLPSECLSILQRRLPQQNIVELKPMPREEGEKLLDIWLHDAGRTLQPNQRSEVLGKFQQRGLPLYLKFAFEESRFWKSYNQRVELSPDVPGIIRDLFRRLSLDANHGQVMVSRSLGYLAAARNGLTEDELLDVLSLDKEVISDFLRRSPKSPPAESLPMVVWSRLYFDLKPYLMERTADGTSLMAFYHPQFGKVVAEEFLAGEVKKKRHQGLAEYFAEPSLWTEKDKKKNPNLRKVSELPYQQTSGELWDEIEKTLCNLHFIEAKCAAGMTYDLIHDYNIALDSLPEAQPEKQERLKHEARVKKYAEDLIAYAKGEIKTLDIIPSVEPWSEEKIRQDTERIIHSPTRLDRIRAFSQFVISESHALVKFAYHPALVVQQAYNSSSSGPVVDVADRIISDGINEIILLKHKFTRPSYNASPEILMTLEDPTGSIWSFDITPDGRKVVYGAGDNSLKVWDLQDWENIWILEGHSETVNCVCITPDGRKAVSGSADNTIKVWDLQSGECIRTLEGHDRTVLCIRITPDGKKAISGSEDRTLREWDLESGQCLGMLEDVYQCPMSNGIVISADGKRVLYQKFDRTIEMWEGENAECVRTLEGYLICVTPDGSRAVSTTDDNTLKVWNLENGECLRTLEGHSDIVWSVSITPDGKLAVSGSEDGTLKVWNLDNGKCVRTLEEKSNSVIVTADGRIAVLLDEETGSLKVWGLERGASPDKLEERHKNMASLSITPDGGKAFSVEHDDTMQVWELKDWNSLGILEGYHNYLDVLSATPDGRIAITVSSDNRAKVWDLEKGECISTLDADVYERDPIGITPDGKRVVIFDISSFPSQESEYITVRRTLRVWDLENGNCVRSLEGETNIIRNMRLSPDCGKGIAISTQHIKDNRRREAANDSSVPEAEYGVSFWTWDFESGEYHGTSDKYTDDELDVEILTSGKKAISKLENSSTLKVWDTETGECLGILEGHADAVWSVSITPDGKKAVSASLDKTIRVWDLNSGKCLNTLEGHTDAVFSVSITPDGKRAVSISPDSFLRLWNLENGECLKIFQDDYFHWVERINISPDGKMAVLGINDSGNLRVWDLENGAYLYELTENSDDCYSVVISPDSRRVITVASDNSSLYVWDLETGEGLRMLEVNDVRIESMAVSQDSKYVVSLHSDLVIDEDRKRAETAKDGVNSFRLYDLESGRFIKNLIGHSDVVRCICISLDGRIAVSGSRDKTVRVWDIETGRCLRTLKGHNALIKNVCISPDGKRIISKSSDNSMKIWAIDSGQCIRTVEMTGEDSYQIEFTGLCFTPDGRRLLTECFEYYSRAADTVSSRPYEFMDIYDMLELQDPKWNVVYNATWPIRIWDLDTGSCLMVLKGHDNEGGIRSVSMTCDGKIAISHAGDIRLWDIDSGKCLTIYQPENRIALVSPIRADGWAIVCPVSGNIIPVEFLNYMPEAPIVTPIRIWIHGTHMENGYWDKDIKVSCPWCNKSFIVAEIILDIIRAVNRDANLSPDQSPCLELPDKAWEEPRLLSECPLCHKPLKFNPFIVDNRGRY